MRPRRPSPLFSRPIPLRDGKLLRTLAQARELSEARRTGRFRCPFTRAMPLIAEAEASRSAEDVDRVRGTIEMALLGRMELNLDHRPAVEEQEPHRQRKQRQNENRQLKLL